MPTQRHEPIHRRAAVAAAAAVVVMVVGWILRCAVRSGRVHEIDGPGHAFSLSYHADLPIGHGSGEGWPLGRRAATHLGKVLLYSVAVCCAW